MFKKALCIVIALAMLCGVTMLCACGNTSTNTTTERMPVTLSVLGVTSEKTTPEAVAAVEKAINNIMGTTYTTHIDLKLVTIDEYYKLVDTRMDQAIHTEKLYKAIGEYNTAALSAANKTVVTHTVGKWRISSTGLAATTIPTKGKSTVIQTQLNEQGILEVVYPAAESPIDVVMIIGEDMYNTFDKAGVITSIKQEVKGDNYTKFSQYIYPTYFEVLESLTDDIKAIPNNNLLAEYTYLLIDRTYADKYDFDIATVDGYDDLEQFLSDVKNGEDVIPMKDVPEALGIFKLFDEDGIAIGTYCDPIIGYNLSEGSLYNVSNIFEIPQFVEHAQLMDKYKEAGYFTSETGSDEYACFVLKGDASVQKIYSDKYDIKVLQNPFVEREKIFSGMLAVSDKSKNVDRAIEFILELTTNPEIKNLFQYGIEGENYKVNDDGTITRLNEDYIMDNGTTGNVYMGYPEEGMLPDQWDYVKKTNIQSVLSPYLSYVYFKVVTDAQGANKKADSGGIPLPIYKIDDSVLDEVLTNALKRYVVNTVMKAAGSDYDYDYYVTNITNDNSMRVGDVVKKRPEYREYFIEKIMEFGGLTRTQAEAMYNTTSYKAKVYNYEWYFDRLVEKFVSEQFPGLYTSEELDAAILSKMAELAGTDADTFTAARTKAKSYYENLEKLKIIARLVIWDDLSNEEWAKYDVMSITDFEQAVFEYVRDHYIEENDLTEEKYEELVKAFIVSKIDSLVDHNDNSMYMITWNQYMDAKKDAADFFELCETIREVFGTDLAAYLGPMYNRTAEKDLPDSVHEMLYVQWLQENGYKKSEFENELYDEILEFLGLNYVEFTSISRTNTNLYREYMEKVKAQYKSVIIDAFSEGQYKNNLITNSKILPAILADKIEQRTGIYASMCKALGVSYSEYKSDLASMSLFVEYATAMEKAFHNTLTTVYTESQISAFDYNDIDSVVFDVISTKGFYTNEMCNFINTNLNSYNTQKSGAKSYLEFVNTLVSNISGILDKYGISKNGLLSLGYDDSFDLIYTLIKTEYFSGSVSIKDLLVSISGEQMAGLEDVYASGSTFAEYVESASAAIKDSGVFSSIVYYLNSSLNTELNKIKSVS